MARKDRFRYPFAVHDAPSTTKEAPRTLRADALVGVALFLIVVLSVLFATGEDTSFIYIDF